MFSEELQDVIDALLGHACPDWPLPPRVATAEDDADQRRYERIEVTRLRLGRALAEQPELTARLSATIFEAILLEDSVTDQLIAPLIAAIGRRVVLEQLIDAVSEGPCERRVRAAQAAYFVQHWRHPQESVLFRSAYAEGARSSAELQSYVARHLPPRAGGIDAVGDLWPRFWQVCLTAFVECDDAEGRRLLQTAFPNELECYPAEFTGLLEQARRIAAADPERFQRMHDQSVGYGYRI
ncbi:hypothetical protein OG417_09480 [Actinoallomurus sp. NBC_01490]|uniref:hypothetical protein n=1 Tax=Actinoallomurus sp. NBC_01490 TaxID=2903557 RepID=UPI002E3366D1|nr:hypothetical protein [Actinoallomurus sp. NBC_01490]